MPRRVAWFSCGMRAAWLVLGLSLAATAGAGYFAQLLVEERAQAELENVADNLRNRIERRLATYEQALHAGAAFLKASNEVTRAEWKTFIGDLSLKGSSRNLASIGFAQAIPPAEKKALERQMRDEGLVDYAISPPGERAAYAPVVYLESFENGNPRAIGFDLYSEPARRAALERARDTGKAALSDRITLFGKSSDGSESGFLMCVPVYRDGMPHAAVQERRESLVGWVIAPLWINNFMHALLDGAGASLNVEIVDLDQTGEDARIFSRLAASGAVPVASIRQKTLSVADRHWLLRFSAAPLRPGLDPATRWVVLSGVITSLLLFGVALALTTTRARALAVADRLMRELRISNDQLALHAKERSAQLQAVLGASPIPIAHLIGKRFNWVSPALEKLMGYPASELIGRSTRMFFRGDDEFEQYIRKISPIVENGDVAFGEQVLVTRDGRQLLCEGFVKALDATDLSRGVVILFQDITERRRNEEALRESERYNRLLFEASPVGLVLCRMDGSLVDCNQAYANILGRNIEDTLRLTYWDIAPERGLADPADQLHALRAAGRDGACEKEYVHHDGHLVPVRMICRIIERGGESFLWAAAQDITEEKANQRQIDEYIERIEQQNLRLAESDRLKMEFLNSMSHELKTPLNAIIGFSELLADGVPQPLSPEQQEYARDILGAGRHLFRLINEILIYSRSEADRLELRLGAVAVASFLDGRVKAVGDAAAAQGVALSVSVAPECGVFLADREYLCIIIDNLLSNAVKFTSPGGRIAVHAALTGDDRENGERAAHGRPWTRFIEIAVADTGIGIAPEKRKGLFQPFIQGDGTLTRRAGGAGLGLALARRLTALHGGTIDVASEPGVGSTFTVRLPWRDVRAAKHL